MFLQLRTMKPAIAGLCIVPGAGSTMDCTALLFPPVQKLVIDSTADCYRESIEPAPGRKFALDRRIGLALGRNLTNSRGIQLSEVAANQEGAHRFRRDCRVV